MRVRTEVANHDRRTIMRRFLLGIGVVFLVVAAVALSGPNPPPSPFEFPREGRNPVSHFRWNLEPEDFQFAIVSDRTGSHRANIYSQAVQKLNLLQPEFVVSVGDLIEGGRNGKQLQDEWREFDSMTSQLTMPFFFAGGNHDVGTPESAKLWEEKLGRRYYHFLYRGVLFLFLNSDDPPGSVGAIAANQAAWARQTLQDNRQARWTIVIVHRPLWTYANVDNNGWPEVEKALDGRPYTVFCGHVHRYQKYVRNGRNYYQLATTGGGSLLRGPDQGEFDHVTWVTMKKDGPVLANLLLDGIQAEDLQKPITDEPGIKLKRKPTHPVLGQAFFEGVPIPGAVVKLQPVKGSTGAVAHGLVSADGSFALSTYAAHDGAAAGEYAVTVVWQPKDAHGKARANQLPLKYATEAASGLKVNVQARTNELVLELAK
jgi:3',5'-cyclic AMP phosphodiesterase CpdA